MQTQIPFKILTTGWLVILSLTPTLSSQETPNTITFDNQSGKPALVRVIGPTYREISVTDQSKETLQVAPGEYYILVRYGSEPDKYTYSKGDPFTVTQTPTMRSAITITLHKVVGGEYGSKPISAKEYNDHPMPKPSPESIRASLANISQILFRLSGSETVNSILCDNSKTISSTQTSQLVIVSLAGRINSQAIFYLNPLGFSAVHRRSSDSTTTGLAFVNPSAVAFHGRWHEAFPQVMDGFARSIFKLSDEQVGAIEIKLAFLIPKGIAEFQLDCPTMLSEKIILRTEVPGSLPRASKVRIVGTLFDQNSLPVKGETLYACSLYHGGAEVSIDAKGQIVNPSSPTGVNGRFDILVDARYFAERSEFVIGTMEKQYGMFQVQRLLVDRNQKTVVVVIDGTRPVINVGEVMFPKK